MKNEADWRPSKVAPGAGGTWTISMDTSAVSTSSRLIGKAQVASYRRALAACAHGDLLDIGCGRVPYYGIYRGLVTSVTTVDWPSSMHDTRHVDLFCDLSCGIGVVPSASADTILATDLIEHLPTPAVFFSECMRVLRPGGVLIIGTPFLYCIHEAPHDFHRLTEYALRHYGREAGFDEVEIVPYAGGFCAVGDLLGKIVARVGWLSLMIQELFCTMVPAVVPERRRKAWEKRFPLGYTAVFRKPRELT
jgi:SAM-dependent methyltransferase